MTLKTAFDGANVALLGARGRVTNSPRAWTRDMLQANGDLGPQGKAINDTRP